MEIEKSKKAFAFSFLVFFLAIVMFAFLHLDMFRDEFTKDNVFIDSRVNYLNEELYYFKSIYLKNAISYSFYNTLNSLSNYTHDPVNLAKINHNYTKFNELIFEGMVNGSFEGNVRDDLVGISDGRNKTLNQFLNKYKVAFDKNYISNLTYEIININVYEEKPYYLTIQVLLNWSVSTKDNISNWNSKEDIFVTVSTFDLPVPDFLYYENVVIPSKSVEYNLPDQNWTLSNFKKTINESYSTIFIENDHKYAIGKSYLKRFLNISHSSYDGVVGFWSFDYDLSEKEVYDTSLNNNFSLFMGNSIGVYNFNNHSIDGVNIYDLTSYGNDGVLNNGVDCLREGIYKEGCYFDGGNDNIELSNFDNIVKDISVFAWINVNTTTVQDEQRIVCGVNEYFCLFINNDGTLSVRLANANDGGILNEITFPTNVSFNEWHNVGFTYDGNITLVYVDGIRHLLEGGSDDSFKYSGDLNGAQGNLMIGESPVSNNNPFEGLIDEVGIFSRVLTMKEIANLYDERKVYFADYRDGFHGKEIYFDGKDDYIDLGDNPIYEFNGDEITIEAWVKLNNLTTNNTIIDKGQRGVNGWGVEISGGKVYFGFHAGATSNTIDSVINRTNYLYHIVVIGGDRSKPDRFFINGKSYPAENNADWVLTRPGNGYNLTIAKASDSDSAYFDGLIDEIKIYNRSLSEEEILNNYYGYSSFGKGCCNYLLLMNPNKFGYTAPVDKVNISYSTKLFYDYHNLGIQYNISLFNLTNVTTFDPSINYYNFLYDDCVNYAYTTTDFQSPNSSSPGAIRVDLYKLEGEDKATCSNLVKMGVY